MPDERTFNQQELGELIRRATERQRVAESTSEAPQLSLDDVKRIAAEIGVEPYHIESALAELGDTETESFNKFLIGAPTSFHVRRRVRGHLSDDICKQIVSDIRVHMKRNKGHVEIIGDSLQWQSSLHWDETSVRVEQDGDFATISAQSTFTGPAFAMHFPLAVLALMGMLAVIIPRNVSAGYIALGVSLALWLALRFALRIASRKSAATMDSLTNSIAATIAGSAPEMVAGRTSNITDGIDTYVDDRGLHEDGLRDGTADNHDVDAPRANRNRDRS